MKWMKRLLIFFHIPQGWKKNNPATSSVNRWMKLLLCRFLSVLMVRWILGQSPDHQGGMPARHSCGFAYSQFPLTFPLSRITKQNELFCFVVCVFFFLETGIFFFALKNAIFRSIPFRHTLRSCLCANCSPTGAIRLTQQSWPAQHSPAATIWKRQPHHVRDIKIHSNPARLHFK